MDGFTHRFGRVHAAALGCAAVVVDVAGVLAVAVADRASAVATTMGDIRRDLGRRRDALVGSPVPRPEDPYEELERLVARGEAFVRVPLGGGGASA